MLRLLVLFLSIPLLLWGSELRIGTLIDGPSRYLEEQRSVIQFEIIDLLGGEYSIQFPEDAQLVGDWTTESVLAQLDRLLADPDVDLVVVVGLLGGHVAAMRGDLGKPVFASSILTDQLPPGQARVPNFAYVASPVDLERDMEVLYELVPFDRMAVLVDRELYTQLRMSPATLEPYREQYGAEFDILLMDEEAAEVLEMLHPDTDVVYIAPPFRSTDEQFAQLVDAINARGLPSFSMIGEDEVEKGVMLGLAPGSDLPRLGRRMALNVQRILFGEDPALIPVELGVESRLSFNEESAARIGYSPPWEIYTEALLFGEPPKEGLMTLCGSFRWVLSVNPELWAARYSVQAGCGEVHVARSLLLPQLGIGALAREIDKARAREALGRSPQRVVELGAVFEQSIYSESRWSEFQIEQNLQCSRVADLARVRLNVLFEVGTAYVSLLLERSLLKIERENLELTRTNLRFAEARVEIGTSRVNEIYRWEAQAATNKEAIAIAESRVRIAEGEVNRLLNRSILSPVHTDEGTIEGLLDYFNHPRLTDLISTPKLFDWFTEFEVQQGWMRSPELKFVESNLRAQCRRLLANGRAYYLPDLDFIAETQQRVVRGGVGMNAGDLSPLILNRGEVNDWRVAFRATFPLFEGGAKRARVQRDSSLVCELVQEYKSVSDQVANDISTALDQGLSSYLSIEFSSDALSAATKNLDFVEDAYAKGSASILDLLDAQQTALDSARRLVRGQANFILDLIQLARSVGSFDFLCSLEARDRWLSQLGEFMRQKEEATCP